MFHLRWAYQWSIGALVLLLAGFTYFLLLNQQSYFIRAEIAAFYSDAQYIAQVAANVAQGYSYSYWDGYIYSFWDYEISTGPIIVYPIALALSMGLDKYSALFYIPLSINLLLWSVMIFFIWQRTTPYKTVLISTLLTLFMLGTQRWLWYLPLGEVSGVIFYLLSLLLIWEEKHVRWAGLLYGLAVLCKLSFVLIAPVLLVYMLIYRGGRNAITYSGFAVLPLILFVISLYVFSPDTISPIGFFQYFYALIIDSFLWALPELMYWEQAKEYGFINKVLWNLNVYNGIWWDNWDFTLFLMTAAIFVLVTIRLALKQSFVTARYKLTLLCGIGLVLFVWAFCVGLKGARYAHPLYVTMFFSTLYLLQFLSKKIAFTIVAVLLSLSVYHLEKRGWVLERQQIDTVERNVEAAASLLSFMQQNQIEQVLFGASLKVPYLDLAYHLPRSDMLLHVYAYLDTLPVLANQDECKKTKWPLLVGGLSTGEKLSDMARCIEAAQPVELQLLADHVLLLEFKIDSPSCSVVAWSNGDYQLFRCSAAEFADYIQKVTKQAVVLSR